jgi:hypothetical protein
VACTGIRHPPGRHRIRATSKQRQKPETRQRPGRTRKLGRKLQGFLNAIR